ncbi:MAG: tyrosine--tRNA ligase, partial [Flavobacteriaceae bacterium]|nr:tyrosine--tRNA ligase [Flavobacteriaceae bacterium]
KEHQQAPHLRTLQKKLAEEVTTMVHSKGDLENAIRASTILFGKSTSSDLKSLDAYTFLEVFEGVPQAEISRGDITNGLDIIAALAANTGFLNSNGEARRELKQNSISVNKEKVSEGYMIKESDLINDRYVLLQRGKKSYFILAVSDN